MHSTQNHMTFNEGNVNIRLLIGEPTSSDGLVFFVCVWVFFGGGVQILKSCINHRQNDAKLKPYYKSLAGNSEV